MKVVIAATVEDCPAVMALRKEGVDFELVLMEHEYSYSDMFTRLWKDNAGFVSIEHDIVPWPGAIDQIQECLNPWCSYEYPLAPGTLRPALGCIKVSDWLVFHYPLLYKVWDNKEWNYLDGSVCSTLEGVAGQTHIHTPPVAHVKK